MSEAYIVDAGRTAFVSTKGRLLSHLQPIELLMPLITTLVERTGVDPNAIDNVLIGTAFSEGEQGFDIAKQAALMTLPVTVPGSVVNSFCTSSLNTIGFASSEIKAGEAHLYLAGGVEMMDHVPMGGFNMAIYGEVKEKFTPQGAMNMGITAENLVEMYSITPQAQAEFAVWSHKKAFAAQQAGRFADAIIPIAGVSQDDCIRPDTSVEAILKLSPSFLARAKFEGDRDGSVNPATSSPVTNGASLVMLASKEAVEKYKLTPLMRVVSTGEVGVLPAIMGLGPVPAAAKALKKANLSMNDIDVIELNEAFAAQVLAVQIEGAKVGIPFDDAKLNLDGGATAQGHPLGASGGRLVRQLADVFKRHGGRYGMVAACAALGGGKVIIFENLQPQPKLHI
jgi:acetyl-CoA acyltransferase